MDGGGHAAASVPDALLAARTSRGRLVATLAARSGDIAAAEDALSDAFRAALEHWPVRGVPDRPEAWLLTAARRRLIDDGRHRAVRSAAAVALHQLAEEAAMANDKHEPFADDRLKLLFVCAHPAIDREARTPLMLQTVLGLDAARIASAFLVSPAAMSQRLVRAKAKIRDARIAFAIPGEGELGGRLDAVLDAIYAAYATGWEHSTGDDAHLRGLAGEAIWLARLTVGLVPSSGEANGLLAMMLFCESRSPARRSPQGAYVPLSEQDVSLWSRPMIEEARSALADAAGKGELGRYQLEAAIQSLHAARLEGRAPDWALILSLYDGLLMLAPGLGARIGRTAALAETDGAEAALAALDDIGDDRRATYQPYWALRADLLQRLGRTGEAAEATEKAMGLAQEGAIRAYLAERQAAASRR